MIIVNHSKQVSEDSDFAEFCILTLLSKLQLMKSRERNSLILELQNKLFYQSNKTKHFMC